MKANTNLRRGVIVILFLLTACGLGGKKMSQSELKHFETRPIDAPLEAVYSAAIEAFFDLGYTMTHSDKPSGILVGEKRVAKPGRWLWGDVPEGKTLDDYFDTLQLTLLVKKDGEKRAKVRIKTAVNKVLKLDKGAVDEVWVYIERQVLMEEGEK